MTVALSRMTIRAPIADEILGPRPVRQRSGARGVRVEPFDERELKGIACPTVLSTLERFVGWLSARSFT